MGSSSSKSTRPTWPILEKSKKRRPDSKLSNLTLYDESDPDNDGPALELDLAIRWEGKLLSEPKNRLALAALSTHASTAILQRPSALLHDTHIFSDQIELEGTPVTNQRSSGRCWLFASTNVFRIPIIKKYKLTGFELSQNYLFFWDKLEKANFFLEQIIDTQNEALDGRLVQYLLQSPVGDGGQWDMVVNLVEKYGLIPQVFYPDSFNSKSSGRINWIITAKLREAALHIRKLDATCKANEIRGYKAQVLEQIYGILVLSLGVPPKPTDTFTWNFHDKESKFRSITTTPVNFYKDNTGAVSHGAALEGILGIGDKGGVAERFSLVNDPRNEYGRLLSVARLGNVVGGRGVKYVNVSTDVMKAAAISMIKAQRPVFFGCDVGKFSESSKGIMDTDLFDYELGYNVSLGMDKAERLRTGESSMTHAMVLSGVHIVDGKPKKWRVENSWGAELGEKGYWVMSDSWFDEYCYQVVTDPGFVSKEILNILKQEPIVLPIWDPMGSLA